MIVKVSATSALKVSHPTELSQELVKALLASLPLTRLARIQRWLAPLVQIDIVGVRQQSNPYHTRPLMFMFRAVVTDRNIITHPKAAIISDTP